MTSGLAMFAACFFILVMMIHVTMDVLGKYLFSVPAPATLEAVQFYYMVALVFLPFAYIARGEGHIYVELFTRSLPPRAQSFLDGMMGILTLAWVVAIAIYAGGEAITTTLDGEFQETAEGTVAVWPSRWFIPIGSGIMAIAVVVKIIADFRKSLGPQQHNSSIG